MSCSAICHRKDRSQSGLFAFEDHLSLAAPYQPKVCQDHERHPTSFAVGMVVLQSSLLTDSVSILWPMYEGSEMAMIEVVVLDQS